MADSHEHAPAWSRGKPSNQSKRKSHSMSNEQTEQSPPVAAAIDSVTFRHSPNVDKLFEALGQAQLEMAGAVRDKRAKIKSEKAEYAYAYSDLESVMDACRPSLNKYGICVIQPAVVHERVITVTTMLGHKSGQW